MKFRICETRLKHAGISDSRESKEVATVEADHVGLAVVAFAKLVGFDADSAIRYTATMFKIGDTEFTVNPVL